MYKNDFHLLHTFFSSKNVFMQRHLSPMQSAFSSSQTSSPEQASFNGMTSSSKYKYKIRIGIDQCYVVLMCF